MVRLGHVVLAAVTVTATPAAAEVLDATYRGTMVCDKLPFTSDKMREAIEVTIAGEVIEQDLCSLRCIGRNRKFSNLSLGPQPSWAARSSFLFDFRTVAGATIFSRISAQVLRTSAVTSE
jgi:hypothetical protein